MQSYHGARTRKPPSGFNGIENRKLESFMYVNVYNIKNSFDIIFFGIKSLAKFILVLARTQFVSSRV